MFAGFIDGDDYICALRAELLERARAHEEAVRAAEYWQERHDDVAMEACAARVGEIWHGSEGRREMVERCELTDPVVRAARDAVDTQVNEMERWFNDVVCKGYGEYDADKAARKFWKLRDALRALEPEVKE